MSLFEDKGIGMPGEFIVTDWRKLGGLLRDTRLTHGLTQTALATKAGVARSWLARVEAGHRGAELEPLLRLLTALDLSLTLSPIDQERQPTEATDRLRAAARTRRSAWGLPGDGDRP
ncbi:helix-turn-helix domain-containing protein [Microlunatus sp. GCM10028923]|uniref:helix-turn-helix domain-containing protein n=1 Tax=Microlunatus sp. GCM10028923 TaxID=3273400 RepID=UPI00360FD954